MTHSQEQQTKGMRYAPHELLPCCAVASRNPSTKFPPAVCTTPATLTALFKCQLCMQLTVPMHTDGASLPTNVCLHTLWSLHKLSCSATSAGCQYLLGVHQGLVKQLLQRVWDKGDIYKAKYEGQHVAPHHA